MLLDAICFQRRSVEADNKVSSVGFDWDFELVREDKTDERKHDAKDEIDNR